MTARADPVLATGLAFLKRFGDDVGRRLEEILPELGITLQHRPATSYEGALLRVEGVPRGYIVLSTNVREHARRLFTLAHELGHYLLPTQQELLQPCKKADIESWSDEAGPRPEVEANRFAAEILMPRSVLERYVKESPRLEHIEQLAQACGTSLTASAYRLVELSSFRVAVVWSEGGRARWYKASSEFERWVRKGELSSESFAFDAFRGKTIPTTFERVPASAWLFEKGLRSDAEIMEQSVLLPNYHAVLTLLMIIEEIEEWDNGEQELDPEEFTLRRKRWPERK